MSDLQNLHLIMAEDKHLITEILIQKPHFKPLCIKFQFSKNYRGNFEAK